MKTLLPSPKNILTLTTLLCTTCLSAGSILVNPLDLDNWPDGWTPAIHGNTNVNVIERDDEDYLSITRPGTSGVGAYAFWDGSGIVQDGWLADPYSGSVIFRIPTGTQTSNILGVIIGAQNKEYTTSSSANYQGFQIGVVPVQSTNRARGMGVWYNLTVGESSEPSDALTYSGFTPNSNLANSETYMLEFDVDGATINAELWLLGSNDEKVSQISSLTYVAEDPIEGYFGFGAGRLGSDGRGAQFRDVSLLVIPEPGTGLLLGMAGILLLGARRSRARSN